MTHLFLSYDASAETLSINTFHNNGNFNDDVVCFVEDIAAGVSCCCYCDLDGALDAVRDGSAWAGTNATTEILEMIDTVICEYELGN